MTPFRMLAALAIILPTLTFADTITGEARIDAVTIYPGQVTVGRQIILDLPAGQHDIVVPNLPQSLSAAGLRVDAPTGTQIGAVNLSYDRLPVTPDQSSPNIIAAKAEVERLQEVLRMRDANINEIRLQVQAANEQITFLQSLAQSSTAELTPADIQAMAQMVGSETLAVKQAAFDAEQEALAAERARKDDVEALQKAEQALAALMAPAQDGSVLTFTIAATEAGEVTIDVSTLEGFATWSPIYDMRLNTGDAPALDIDRAVVVSQQTGQDWLDVTLTLSTARPGEQIAPSHVSSFPRRIISEDELERAQLKNTLMQRGASFAEADMIVEEAMMEPMSIAPTADFSGAAVTYTYPGRVNIRNGVEDLRLPLDTINLDADIWAEAVPSRDSIAYRVAEFTNTTDEILLPGPAMIFADGTMMGFSQLGLLAAGADTQMGFGPLDGLRLTRTIPNKSEGETGVFSSANRLEETAILQVENLTGQTWEVLLRDTIPYSEQDDLEISFDASPSVTRTNPDGRRGILEWDLEIPAGEKDDVTLEYTVEWPTGFILQ